MTGQAEDPFGKKAVRTPTKTRVFSEISRSPVFSPGHFFNVSWGNLQLSGAFRKSRFSRWIWAGFLSPVRAKNVPEGPVFSGGGPFFPDFPGSGEIAPKVTFEHFFTIFPRFCQISSPRQPSARTAVWRPFGRPSEGKSGRPPGPGGSSAQGSAQSLRTEIWAPPSSLRTWVWAPI